MGTLVALLAAVSFVQADLKPEQLLAENTVAVFSVRNQPKTWSEFQQTPMGLLLNDPVMKPFCDGAIDLIKTELADEGINIDWASYMDFVSGGIAGALTQLQINFNEDGGLEEPAIIPVFMVEVSDGAKFIAKIKELNKESEGVKTRTIEGTEFTIQSLGDSSEIWFGAKNNLFIATLVGNFDEGITDEDIQRTEKELIAILKGKREGSLADSTVFKENTAITPERDYVFLNFQPITDGIKKWVKVLDDDYEPPKDIQEAMMATPRPMVIYNSLGLSALKSLSYSSWTENGESLGEALLVCPANERRGLTAFVNTLKIADCTPLPQVSVNVFSYDRSWVDVEKIWKNIDNTTTEALGGLKMVFMGMIQQQLDQNKDIDLEKNILKNITGEVNTIWYDTKNENENLETLEAYLVGSKDPQAVIDTIINAIKTMNPGLEIPTKDINGTKVYVFKSPDVDIQIEDDEDSVEIDDDSSSDSLYFTALDKYFVVATDEGAIKYALDKSDKGDKSLAKLKGLSAAVDKIGGYQQVEVGYADLKNTYTTFQASMNNIFSRTDDEDMEKVKAVFDKLPKLQEIEKYLGYYIYKIGRAHV